MGLALRKEECAGCGRILGNEEGESSICGSHDIGPLCMTCWNSEEELIEKVGTNSPELSEEIGALLEQYRSRQ